ncbi:TPA: hypothetical protein ACX6NV_000583 [Photobacterium damselae]
MGVIRCRERYLSGKTWVPSAADFLKISRGIADIDYEQAFFRCLNREPQGDIEQYVFENHMWDLRRMDADRAARFFKKYMDSAAALYASGKLVLRKDMPIGIAKNTTVSVTDIERNKFAESGCTHKFQGRINEMLAKKRGKKC